MSGKNPDSSDKFIVVDNIGSNSSRQSDIKILVEQGQVHKVFVGALSTNLVMKKIIRWNITFLQILSAVWWKVDPLQPSP